MASILSSFPNRTISTSSSYTFSQLGNGTLTEYMYITQYIQVCVKSLVKKGESSGEQVTSSTFSYKGATNTIKALSKVFQCHRENNFACFHCVTLLQNGFIFCKGIVLSSNNLCGCTPLFSCISHWAGCQQDLQHQHLLKQKCAGTNMYCTCNFSNG